MNNVLINPLDTPTYWNRPAPEDQSLMLAALFYLRKVFPRAGLSGGKSYQSSHLYWDSPEHIELAYQAFIAGYQEAHNEDQVQGAGDS